MMVRGLFWFLSTPIIILTFCRSQAGADFFIDEGRNFPVCSKDSFRILKAVIRKRSYPFHLLRYGGNEMKLAECLNASDIQTLRQIAETYQLECSKSSKNALIQSLMAHLWQAKEVWRTLDDRDYREIVAQIMFDQRPFFSREEIFGIIKRTIREEERRLEDLFHRLLKDGWIYQIGRATNQSYYVPEDLRQRIRAQGSAESPVVYRDEGLALVRDTQTFLDYASQHVCKLTQEGVLYKRHLTAILQLLEIEEQPLPSGWRFGYGRRFHDYPDRFALIYDFCYDQQLVFEDVGALVVCSERMKEWLRKEEKERLRELFLYWQQNYRSAIPTLPLILQKLGNILQSGWVFADSIKPILWPHVPEYYYDSKEQILEKRICGMLVHLGLLCHGKMADDRSVLRLSELGKELIVQKGKAMHSAAMPRFSLIVQPNFLILVLTEEREDWEEELEQWTEAETYGAKRAYRLTKRSMYRAFQEGWTAKTVLAFLRKHSGSLLPANVIHQIQQWEREYGRIVLYRTAVIECANEEIAAEVQKIPPLQREIRDILQGRFLLVPEESLPHVAEILWQHGYMPDQQF